MKNLDIITAAVSLVIKAVILAARWSGKPTNAMPRFEPRSRWPRGSPCVAPQAKVQGKNGSKLVLVIGFYEGRKHLPVIELKRAA